jgi:transcriptional regulator with XRE-family HTH domain
MDIDIKHKVGNLVARLRLERGINSQNALSEMADVAQSTIRELELGGRTPNIETLAKICDVLDLTLAEFFNQISGDEEKLIIEGLTPDNKRNLTAIANTMKNNQKLPPDSRADSSGLTPLDKEVNNLKYKKAK